MADTKLRGIKSSDRHESRLRQIGFNFEGKGAANSFDNNWKQSLSKFMGNISFVEFDSQLDCFSMQEPLDIESPFCGLYFPRSLMVAAHIKHRALYAGDERLNFQVINLDAMNYLKRAISVSQMALL